MNAMIVGSLNQLFTIMKLAKGLFTGGECMSFSVLFGMSDEDRNLGVCSV
jgi:hypothetical protein